MSDSSERRPKFGSALSTASDSIQAARDASMSAVAELPAAPDLAMVFFSPHHADAAKGVASTVLQTTGARNLLGCSGESIVGPDREIEGNPAIAVWAACLPDVDLVTMRLSFQQTIEGGSFAGWPDALAGDWPRGVLLLLADPFSFPADDLGSMLNEERAGIPLVGGMASGGNAPGSNALVFGDVVVSEGAVGVLLAGNLTARCVVSQGCRPIGQPFVVTKAQQNVVFELGGRSAYQQLEELYGSLDDTEQELVRQGLHLGRVISEYRDRFGPGDFLVRNVIGADPKSGAIAVGDVVRVGQTVQFHVRDAQTADEDLRQLLEHVRADQGAKPGGALLFTCNGRGTRFFASPNHDVGVLRECLGDLPAAGFLAQGELGPVGTFNSLHGFTASILLLGPAQ